MILDYLAVLGLTLVVELPIFALAAPPGRRSTVVTAAFAANLLSHPLAWWAMTVLGAPFWPVEFAVFALEAIALVVSARLNVLRAVLGSAIANAATVGLSFVV